MSSLYLGVPKSTTFESSLRLKLSLFLFFLRICLVSSAYHDGYAQHVAPVLHGQDLQGLQAFEGTHSVFGELDVLATASSRQQHATSLSCHLGRCGAANAASVGRHELGAAVTNTSA